MVNIPIRPHLTAHDPILFRYNGNGSEPHMPNIEIDFEKFLPSLGTYYNYFEILKYHQFIEDINVIQEKGTPMLRILRTEDLAMKPRK